MGLYPKASGDLQGIDPEIFPPGLLVARLMQLPVMTPTERHREFIADLQAERPWLGKAQMMRVTWLAPDITPASQKCPPLMTHNDIEIRVRCAVRQLRQ